MAALELTDVLIGMPRPLSPELQSKLQRHYTDAQVVEMALGVGLFLGMSKLLIALGLEPEEMDTTLAPTPGSS